MVFLSSFFCRLVNCQEGTVVSFNFLFYRYNRNNCTCAFSMTIFSSIIYYFKRLIFSRTYVYTKYCCKLLQISLFWKKLNQICHTFFGMFSFAFISFAFIRLPAVEPPGEPMRIPKPSLPPLGVRRSASSVTPGSQNRSNSYIYIFYYNFTLHHSFTKLPL